MKSSTALKWLKFALFITGVIFVFAIYPLTVIWPAGWAWHSEGVSLYLQMILGIYATLGVFLIIASKNPLKHLSLIWFTVWSSIIHGVIMMIQSLYYPMHIKHLLGDVPALFLVAFILGLLTWQADRSKHH
ncbi:Uncharacterised protein [Legionella lansingensis]|uniref:Transmembrane protein n=1 Tax=Legionella lansingensis TaxID=45067 RepID=A0A0W0VG72_9GAMM|nr:DUF6632 domain-containing protein [Legionella lansingensis]KTD19155.1 hypothetical protein Llan_2226 [Legionella lansingensis]SNV45423.1 Uncharacterised protein [Legionella lansingensis]